LVGKFEGRRLFGVDERIILKLISVGLSWDGRSIEGV
jgi:hypothetical protein